MYTERGLLLLFLKTENIGGCAIFSFLESQFRPSFSVYENPQHAEVALFMGVKNVLKGESREGYFRSGDFIVELYGAELAGNQSGWFILRPESLQPVSKEMTSNEQHIRNLRVIYGTVKDISFRQGFYDLKVQIGSIILEVIEKSRAVSLPEPGEPITLQFDIPQTRFIPDHRMEGGNNDA